MQTEDGRRRAPTPVFHSRGDGSRNDERCPSGKKIVGGLVFLAVLGGLFMAGFRIETVPAIVMSEARGRVITVLPLADRRFIHTYVHSIHQSKVDEFFELEGKELRLYELRFNQTSVGMPSDAGNGFRLEDGRFVLAMDRRFERISIAVSPLPGHGLVIGGVFHPFTEWVPREESLVLSAKVQKRVAPRYNPRR